MEQSDEEPNYIWPNCGNDFYLEDWGILDLDSYAEHSVLEYPPASLYTAVFRSRDRPWKYEESGKYFNHGFKESTWRRYCEDRLKELEEEGDSEARDFNRDRRRRRH